MTRRRWIADEAYENHAALTGNHADHLTRVLRARVGQEFDIATGSVVRRGRVTKIAEGRIDFELGEEIPSAVAVDLTVLLSIFKFDRMEWAIEKVHGTWRDPNCPSHCPTHRLPPCFRIGQARRALAQNRAPGRRAIPTG